HAVTRPIRARIEFTFQVAIAMDMTRARYPTRRVGRLDGEERVVVPKRWRALAEFVELFHREPLALSSKVKAARGETLAFLEWEALTAGRWYAGGGEGYWRIEVESMPPSQRMNPPEDPVCEEWCAILQEPSGHEIYFVDGADASADPRVYHWDDEADMTAPEPAFEHLSELLTWATIEQTLGLDPGDEAPLGPLQPDVRFA